MKISDVWRLVKDSGTTWVDADAQTLGAALAYYTAFSIAPLLVIVLAVAGLVFGKEAANGEVAGQIAATAGPIAAQALQEVLAHAHFSGATPWALAASVVMLLVGASGVFTQLQNSLNTIWHVKIKPGQAILQMVRDRFLSFAMVLVSCFVLLCSLLLTAVLDALAGALQPTLLPGVAFLWQLGNIVVSLVVVTVLFALIYKVLPDVRIDWQDVWVGALVTALLFAVGKHLLSLYVTFLSPASPYGAAGSLAVFLLWIYYSAQIFLFGAAFTRAYAAQRGRSIRPAENAVEVPEPAVAAH